MPLAKACFVESPTLGLRECLPGFTFFAEGFSPVLVSFNCFAEKTMSDGMTMIVGEKRINGKRYILSTLDFRMENPIAKRFMKALLESD